MLEISFKHLGWNPSSFAIHELGNKQVLPPTAGAVPAVCLRIFWKAVDAARLKPPLWEAILNAQRLEGSVDGVCHWTRFCLPFLQHRCVPGEELTKKHPNHREKYIAQSRLLLQLLWLDIQSTLVSCDGMADLLIDLFVTEDGGGKLKAEEQRCFMEVGKAEPCPIVELVHRILTDPDGMDTFLRRMEKRGNYYSNFCFAITNRLSKACYNQVPRSNPSGILMSVEKLLEMTADLCASSPIFSKMLAQWDHLSAFSWILNTVSAFMTNPEINAAGYITSMIPMIDPLCEMVYQNARRSAQVRAWSDLLSGEFIRLFMRVTTALKESDDPRWLKVFRNLEVLGTFMVFPNILARCPRMTAGDFALPKLGGNYTVIAMWSRFWRSLDWAQRTQDIREGRPSVDICDYPSVSPAFHGHLP